MTRQGRNGDDEDVSVICPACGKGIDISGPAVASHPSHEAPEAPWQAFWVPFVEDLRGTPTRLVHVECFVAERGLPELIDVLHQRDKAEREREYHEFRRWLQAQREKPR